MVEFITQLTAREHARAALELAFARGGAWDRVASRCPGFRGTTLLRGVRTPRCYLVVELWEAEGDREAAIRQHEAEYASFEALLAEWAESRSEVGAFRMVGEASVRPHAGERRAPRSGGVRGRRARAA